VLFKNVSTVNFDSLKIKVLLYDSSGNVADSVPVPAVKALVAGDTVKVAFATNVTALPQGQYNLFVSVNPGSSQPEQYLFNNSLYKYTYILRNRVLPVNLLSFNAAQQDEGVLLNWAVTSETGFSGYLVERSNDGRNYIQTGYVPAAGNNAAVKNYAFTDNSPLTGKNYYRLKMVDLDGLFSYSRTEAIDFGGAFAVKVYPNPFGSLLNVSVNGGGTAVNFVTVLDFAGKKVLQQPFTGGTTALDVSGLAAGTYMVQVNNGNTIKTFKLQKQAE
jgi:hypothetical protein